MKVAKYYIYRNLHTGGFSVRYRGRVVNRLDKFTAINVKFKVNDSGRKRVIGDGRKNVHAFVVADKYKGLINSECELDKLVRITYNPYIDTQFKCQCKDIYSAREVVFNNGCCYLSIE